MSKRAKQSTSSSNTRSNSAAEMVAKLAALDRVQAVIEFALDGTILHANENFLRAMGYTLAEIVGQHHRVFVDPQYAHSPTYASFWDRLRAGNFDVGEYKRIAKGGREVWIQASYNPIFDAHGKPLKIVKFATDVTEQKLRNADYAGQIAAIGKAQAVIEFAMDGTVLNANENFLRALGYTLEEIKGKPHATFMPSDQARSDAYRRFWERLREGSYEAGEYKRIGKGGREVWIQASYNPILDSNGKPFKVVKYATDITEQKLRNADYSGQIAAIDKAQAVIAFNMDGTIRSANENFLRALGYTWDEIKGRHHSIFVEPEERNSPQYQEFWQNLRAGKHTGGEYKRIGKDGREVWIQATYNPILDLDGKPFKVVKYATDITQQKQVFLQLSSVIDALSRGDLTQSMHGNFEGDHAALRDKMNSTIAALSALISQIDAAVTKIEAGADDISQGNSNLNTRTQEQSRSLQSTAASIEQLTATVKQNAGHTATANQLAASAREAADKGGQVVSSAVSAMSAITDASKKVADIIGVIEQISFQTNMLALNAAVEAARAGDQGRGFAVVAAEVRTLAQRSATAAREIKVLIQNSQEKVEHGAKLVNHSGTTLNEIMVSVAKVNDIIGQIDAASDQQASGIDQINIEVAQMDNNTRQNASLVEEASAAADLMTQQTRSMAELVRSFRVNKAANNNGAAARHERVPHRGSPAGYAGEKRASRG